MTCPNCGYCPSCGRGYNVQPYLPWKPYTAPWPSPTPIWYSTTNQTKMVANGTYSR